VSRDLDRQQITDLNRRREERKVIARNYSKPEITAVPADTAIQGQQKDIYFSFDPGASAYITLGAYEADE
jgi:hypothetical protein